MICDPARCALTSSPIVLGFGAFGTEARVLCAPAAWLAGLYVGLISGARRAAGASKARDPVSRGASATRFVSFRVELI